MESFVELGCISNFQSAVFIPTDGIISCRRSKPFLPAYMAISVFQLHHEHTPRCQCGKSETKACTDAAEQAFIQMQEAVRNSFQLLHSHRRRWENSVLLSGENHLLYTPFILNKCNKLFS